MPTSCAYAPRKPRHFWQGWPIGAFFGSVTSVLHTRHFWQGWPIGAFFGSVTSVLHFGAILRSPQLTPGRPKKRPGDLRRRNGGSGRLRFLRRGLSLRGL